MLISNAAIVDKSSVHLKPETIEYSVSCHPCEQLNYRNVILNVESGGKNTQYVTKSFNVIPSKVNENRQIISVQGEHRIRTEQKHDSLQIRSKNRLYVCKHITRRTRKFTVDR